MATLVFSLEVSSTAALSTTVSLAAPVVEVFWTTARGASAATGERGSPEGSPVATVWAGAEAGARALPVTNLFKPLQFWVSGLVVEPWYGAVGGTAVGPRTVGFVVAYWRSGFSSST